MKHFLYYCTVCALIILPGCNAAHDYYNMASAEKIIAQPVVPGNDTGSDLPVTGDVPDPAEPDSLFDNEVGSSVSADRVADPSILTDFDGDGIPNDEELTTNKYVADCPRIVTRIETPITMKLLVNVSSSAESFSETIDGSEVKDTIRNSMESKQYDLLNKKTTPYVTKESYSNSNSHSESFGFNASASVEASGSVHVPLGGGGSSSVKVSASYGENSSLADSLAIATMSEKTVFDDVSYVDNLDRNGSEFTSDTVKNITKSYRKSDIAKTKEDIGPNAGYVSANLFIKNITSDIPVHISNIECTLSFRTPSGKCEAVQTFTLRHDDYSSLSCDIGGSEEYGPYAIEVKGLNTERVKTALLNGYVPQITVTKYDMTKVKDSTYNPGLDNLKMIEEKAKSRTATIRIIGKNIRESYRVAAFDYDDARGTLTPGISLKKALFNILQDRAGRDRWSADSAHNPLTVMDADLRWRRGSDNLYPYNRENAVIPEGNTWKFFSTYMKTWKDESGKTHCVETIKSIWDGQKYNPFDPRDNKYYNANERLADAEIEKMTYWVILHNGRYFEGDINDPVWQGERFEIICVDVPDFNEHFKTYYYSPLQSQNSFTMDTRWNALTNEGDYARALYLGKVLKGDVVHLALSLKESRMLFPAGYATDISASQKENGRWSWQNSVIPYWTKAAAPEPNGIPQRFTHTAHSGFNSLIVDIGESLNAHWYEILLQSMETGSDGNPLYRKKISVSAQERARQDGVIWLNRGTMCTDGSLLGIIPARSDYRVFVSAYGKAWDCPVSTRSEADSITSIVAIKESSDLSAAPGFSASVTGGKNEILVSIYESAAGADCYEVILSSPMNGAYCAEAKTVVCHKGNNFIRVDNPFSSGDLEDPGVYEVTVNALNRSAGKTLSWERNQYAVVQYERYAKQKDTEAALSQRRWMQSCADLEVSFNDGADWYRLQLDAADSLSGSRVIDCRNTSYAEYDAQLFHIYFTAPSGTGGLISSLWDVFSGGRDEADLYLRTSADAKYRDTFWPRNGSGMLRTLPLNETETLVSYYTHLNTTDATKIESTLGAYASDTAELQNGLGLIKGKENYFFSPLERRVFSVTAAFAPEINTQYSNTAHIGSFSIMPAERALDVRVVTDNCNAERFAVYWQEYTASAPNADCYAANNPRWRKSAEFTLVPEGNTGISSSLLAGLVPNRKYTVGIIPLGNTLEPGGLTLYTNADGSVHPVVPFAERPVYAPTFVVNQQAGKINEFLISSLTVPGECRYRMYYRTILSSGGYGDWMTLDSYNGNEATLSDQPISLNIVNLDYWTRYQVKGCAVSLNGEEGPFSTVFEMETGIPSSSDLVDKISISNIDYLIDKIWVQPQDLIDAKVNISIHQPDYLLHKNIYSEIVLNNISLPKGLTRYSVYLSFETLIMMDGTYHGCAESGIINNTFSSISAFRDYKTTDEEYFGPEILGVSNTSYAGMMVPEISYGSIVGFKEKNSSYMLRQISGYKLVIYNKYDDRSFTFTRGKVYE